MADIKPGVGSSAIVPATGPVRQLDARREPDELVTPDRLDDKPRVARWLADILRDVAALKRRWAPRRMDFQDVALDDTGGSPNPKLYRLTHLWRGRVRWWVVQWQGAAAAPALVQYDGPTGTDDGPSGTDQNTLVLRSYVAGKATIRIEEAG